METKKLSKYFLATMAATVAVSSAGVIAPDSIQAKSTFPDVKETEFFYKDVLQLAERGIVQGFPDGTYRPYQDVNRGQAAKIIAGVLGLDTKNVKNPSFKDVSTSNEYYGAIAALQNAGIINGYPDGTYKPAAPIERNHMAKIIANAFELTPSTKGKAPFTDMYKDYQEHITALYEYGVTTGRTSTTFDGNANVTRGQLAAFVMRAENLKESVSFTLESYTDETVVTSKGQYKIAKSLQPLFTKQNAGLLKNAQLTASVIDGKMVEITDLTLSNGGEEKSKAALDGGNVAINGNVTVNADHIALNRLTVNGNVTLTSKAATDFTANQLVSNGEFIIEEVNNNVASLEGMIANLNAETKIDLNQSTISLLHTKRDNVSIQSNNKIKELKVSGKVSNVEVNADVETVTVNVKDSLQISGKGEVDQIVVNEAKEFTLDTSGKVKELYIANDEVKVEIGENAKLDRVKIPKDADITSIIQNYHEVKDNIHKIVESDGKTVDHPGSLVGGGGGGSSSGSSKNKNFTLSIMHSNDTHANLNDIAKKVTAVKEVREEKPNALLIDAGDVFTGTLYFNEFLGQADLEFMNLMGYDIMTFGNHEFDLGSSPEGHQALADFIEGAKFSFVSSNIDFSKDEKFQGLFSDLISSEPENGKIYSGIVKEINGEKVGFFGLTTAETASISSPGKIEFEDYIQEAEKAVKSFEGMGVNKIVAVTHIGYDDNPNVDNDLLLAEKVEGIDIIVGGHSHTQLDEPVIVDENGTPTVIVQAGQYNNYLGTLDVEFNENGVVVDVDGKLLKIADYAEDPDAAEKLKPYKEKLEAVSNEEIGVVATAELENPRTDGDNSKPSVRKNETALGNLITDGMLQKAKEYNSNVIMSLQNGGGIRAPINRGPITVGEVITVLPFGNTLAVMDVTGEELKAAFEHSVRSYPIENGGFLHVSSGVKVEFDSSKPAGERIVKITYTDAEGNVVEIKDHETYTIATNAFTAKGGDGFDMFGKAYEEGRVTDLGLSDWENFRDYLVSLGETVTPTIEGRIVDVNTDSENPTETISDMEFSGTTEEVKVYNGNVTVSVKDVTKFSNVHVKGNLVLTGNLQDEVSFSNIVVDGNLDLSQLDADISSFEGITVHGETIL